MIMDIPPVPLGITARIPWRVLGFFFLAMALSGCIESEESESSTRGFCSAWNEGATVVEYSSSWHGGNASMPVGVHVLEDNGTLTFRVVQPTREAGTAEVYQRVIAPGVTLDAEAMLVRVTLETHETDAFIPYPHQGWLDIHLLDPLPEGAYRVQACADHTQSIMMEYTGYEIHEATFHVE